MTDKQIYPAPNTKEKTNRCISSVTKGRDTGWEISYNFVENLVEEYGDDLFAERLLNDIPAGTVSGILNIEIRSTNDNGAGIIKSATE